MIIWNRLKYVLSPQFDIYKTVAKIVRGRIADIGFGTGFGSHLLATNGADVYGFEVDETAIRFAQEVFTSDKLHFTYGDIVTRRGMDGLNNIFDWVVMIDVIEHIEDDRQAVMNVRKCLKEKGLFVCSTPNRLSRYRKSSEHIREYSPEELRGLLKQVFATVELRNYKLEPIGSQYENPLLAVCGGEVKRGEKVKTEANNIIMGDRTDG